LINFAKEVAKAESVSICWAMGITQQECYPYRYNLEHCYDHVTDKHLYLVFYSYLLRVINLKWQYLNPYPLRGHNNVQGCSDMGSMPDQFTGYQKVVDDDVRAKFEINIVN
jgi:formate dehydrogenase major subunit